MKEKGTEKVKDLKSVIKGMLKQGMVVRTEEEHASAVEKHEHVPTGIYALDYATGIGGIPRGRVIEIFGPEAGGKTTLGLQILAHFQKNGGKVFLFDVEHTHSSARAEKLGADVENLTVVQYECEEDVLQAVLDVTETGEVSAIMIDSVSAMAPRAELNGEMDDQQMGLQARILGKFLRKITGLAARTGTTIIFINQLREKVGVMFGNPETTSGGKALKFWASMRFRVSKVENIKNGDDIIGCHVRTKVEKNKLGAPFRTAEFDILFNDKIDTDACLLDFMLSHGIISQSGPSYSYEGKPFAKGILAALEYIKSTPEFKAKLDATFTKMLDASSTPPEPQAKDESLEEGESA